MTKHLFFLLLILALPLCGWQLKPGKSSVLSNGVAPRIGEREILADGSLAATILGADPFFDNISVGVDAEEARYVVVDMAFTGLSGSVQAFINLKSSTGEKPFYSQIMLNGDGKIRRYVMDLSKRKEYAEMKRLETLRIDPAEPGRAGEKFVVQTIHVVRDLASLPPLPHMRDTSTIEYDFQTEDMRNHVFISGEAAGLKNRRLENGALCADIVSNDPYFSPIAVDRPLSEINRLSVEMAAENCPQGRLQLMVNLGKPGSCYTFVPLKDDGNYHTYTVKLDSMAALANVGILHNFRLDPVDPGMVGGKIRIKAIRFFSDKSASPNPLTATVPKASDGVLRIESFRQLNTGGKASAKTQALLSYDKTHLVFDVSTEIENLNYRVAGRKRDGQIWLDDSLEFFIQKGDLLFQIVVNPDGVVYDHCETLKDGKAAKTDVSWNADVIVHSNVTPGTWHLVLKVPFASMNVTSPEGEQWKMNIVRNSVADSKGASSWNFYRGNNGNPDDLRHVELGDKASPRIDVLSVGNLYLGQNDAVFANPDNAPLKAMVVLRNLDNGHEERFHAEGSGEKISVPYKIDASGHYEMHLCAGDGKRDYFADALVFESIDVTDRIRRKLAVLKDVPPVLQNRADLIRPRGEKLLAQLASNGQTDMREYESFRKDAEQFRQDAVRLRFLEATETFFNVKKSPFALAVADTMCKVFRTLDEEAPSFPCKPIEKIEIEGAARETEGVQIVLMGLDEPVEGLSFSFEEPFPNAFEIHYVDYIDTSRTQTAYVSPYKGEWPEMLCPGVPPSLARHEIRPLWLNVRIPANAKAGIHEGAVILKAGKGFSCRIPVSVNVWGFTLPATPRLRTALSQDQHQAIMYYEKLLKRTLTDAEKSELMDRLAKFMLSHRMNPGNIYDWTAYSGKPVPYPEPSHWREYTAMGMNAFPIANLTPRSFGAPAADMRSWYEADNHRVGIGDSLRANYALARDAGIETMLFMHGFDEVGYHKDFVGKSAVIKDLVTYWRSVEPSLKIECITTVNESLTGSIGIWCPTFSMMEKHKDDYMARKKAGDELWLYTCLGTPADGHAPSFVLEAGAMDLRLVGWMCHFFNADGFLYYRINGWKYCYPETDGRHWPDKAWNAANFPGYNGDACLIYPSPDWHRPPYSSVRMENLRDGFEDYDMLKMLEEVRERFSQEERIQIDNLLSVKALMSSSTEYSKNPTLLREQRRQVAYWLEKAQGKQ